MLINLLLIYIGICTAYINIEDFGAIANTKSVFVAENNSNAIVKAFNYGLSVDDKTICVPDKLFYISSTYIENMDGMTFIVNGVLRAHDRIKYWPFDENNKRQNILNFYNMNNLKITGDGIIDGQGYRWWWMAILGATGKTQDIRPQLINIEEAQNFELSGITMMNSPRYHLRLYDVINVHVHHFKIEVDLVNQKKILNKLPTFPLNTDGIDPYATNVKIHDFYIKNYDDAIAVKPCNTGMKYCHCSSNMEIYNGHTFSSVGLAIGSVPPNDNHNCISDIYFHDIKMDRPLKGIYIKTNEGNHGDGEITNIKYENITMDTPVWWGIYIGPQQQKQPDGKGEGCMKYPKDPDCPTEPAITISKISLININITNNLNPYAGLIRCNETNPCEDFIFDNVNVDTIGKNRGYICENTEMTALNSHPVPCFNE